LFPKGRFPFYAEDMMKAFRQKVEEKNATLFNDLTEGVKSGRGMTVPLADYVAAYVSAQPDEFSA
jgi:hypothetical protein